MDPSQLQLFVKVAATGSFSRTATLVGSTQSSISKRIADLERACKQRLFDRTGRGVTLTDAGRWLLPRAMSLSTEMERLIDDLASALSGPQGVVRLAVQPSVAWPLIERLYAQVKVAYPGIHLQILEGATGDIEFWLRQGRVDLAMLNRGVTHDSHNASYLFSTLFHLISVPGDSVTAAPTIPFRRLQPLALIAAVVPNAGRLLMEEAAQRAGITFHMAIEVNSVHLMKNLVAAGHGYGVTSRQSILSELSAGTLQASRIVAPRLEEHFSLVASHTKHPGMAVRTVAALTQRIAHGAGKLRPDSGRITPSSRGAYPL